MSKFDDISDELLAAYLDGNYSDEEMFLIEDSILSVNDLGILLLSQSVMNKMTDEINGLPNFAKSKVVKFTSYVNCRAVGFLGSQKPIDPHSQNESNIDDDKQED